jgi:ATP-dependent Clp endopeptidase proteolytic subunit ClpP
MKNTTKILAPVSFRAMDAGEAEILIYDEIDPLWGTGAKEFARGLKELGEVTTIHVRINSPGGDVFDGLAIYNQLAQHSAKVIVHVDGLAASIASVIAMAGDVIDLAENALIMIHDPWLMTAGTAADLRASADLLDTVAASIVNTYAARTGRDVEEIRPLMAAETWMDATEAVGQGFADQVTEAKRMAARFDPLAFGFKNTPDDASGPPAPPEETTGQVEDVTPADDTTNEPVNHAATANRLRLMALKIGRQVASSA